MDCVGCIKAGVADMPWALSVIWEARMVSKYDPLRRHLANSAAKTVFMTFAEIEKTLAFKLPKSARQYQAWWANASPNTGHPYSKAWTSTGRKASVNLTAQTVVFERR